MQKTVLFLFLLLANLGYADESHPLSDADIAAIVLSANQVDVEAGEFALERSSDPKIRALAERMVVDHRAANDAARELASKLNLTPRPNKMSRALEKGGRERLAALGGLCECKFDQAYLKNEITYHRTVLDAIDTILLPGTQNQELRALIEKVRPVIAEHLTHAEHLANERSEQ